MYLVGKCWVFVGFVLNLLKHYPPGKRWANSKFAQYFVHTLPSQFYSNFVAFLSIYPMFYSLSGQKPTGQSVNKVLGKFNICPALAWWVMFEQV